MLIGNAYKLETLNVLKILIIDILMISKTNYFNLHNAQ